MDSKLTEAVKRYTKTRYLSGRYVEGWRDLFDRLRRDHDLNLFKREVRLEEKLIEDNELPLVWDSMRKICEDIGVNVNSLLNDHC